MNFPDFWPVTRLGDLVIGIQPGFAQRPGEDEGAVPQIRTHNVSPEGQIDLGGIKYVTPSLTELAKYTLQRGDVIFNNTNSEEWVGKTAYFSKEGTYVFSNHMSRIRTNPDLVDNEFLARYLHFLWHTGYSKQRAKRWVSQAAVDQATLAEYQVPHPPLLEQQRIVAILRQADELRQRRQETKTQISKTQSALFDSFFSHLEKEPDVNKTISLRQITSFITSGSRDWARYYSDSEKDAKFIRVQNIKRGKIDLSDIAFVAPPAGAEAERSRILPSDILISITGTIGQAAVAPEDLGEAYISQHVALVRLDGSLSPEFVVAYINGACGQHQLMRANYGQVKPGLNLKQIQDLRIPIPDSKEIENFLGNLHAIESLQNSAKESSGIFEQIYDSLLGQAFTGDLTASWRHSHRRELAAAARERDARLGRARMQVRISEQVKPERKIPSLQNRHDLLNQLSPFQFNVLQALNHEWRGTLIPKHDIEDFRAQCFQIEHEENADEKIRNALTQLAGLGLIAAISVPNEQGEYVTAYRPLRTEEVSLIDDLERLTRLQSTSAAS